MLLIGLVAFGCGVLVGYVSLRSLGWLVVLCLLSLNAEAAFNSYVTTVGAGTVDITLYAGSGSCPGSGVSGYQTYWGGGSPSSPGTWPIGNVTDGYGWYKLEYRCNGGAWHYTGCYDPHTTPTINLSDCSWSQGASTYYMNGCITNKSNFPAKFGFNISGISQPVTSGFLAPGEWWCYSITNNNPFTYQPFAVVYGPDGATNFVNQGGTYPAWTNTVPGPGGSGSVGGGDVAGNNPIGPGAGAGSTNGLTGGQFANGASNLVNVIVQGGNANNAALKGIADILNAGLNGVSNDIVQMGGDIRIGDTNIENAVKAGNSNVVETVRQSGSNVVDEVRAGSSNVVDATKSSSTNIVNALTNLVNLPGQPGQGTNDYSGLLAMIQTNTAAISNSLAVGTNALQGSEGTFQGVTINKGDFFSSSGWSNMAVGISGAMSNSYYQAQATNAGGFFQGTNVATTTQAELDEDAFVTLPIKTNTVGTPGLFKLKFRETQLWIGLCPWIRMVAQFIITLFAVMYIHWRFQEECKLVGSMASDGPFKSNTSWATYLFGIVAVGTVMAGAPILIANAVLTIVNISGGSMVASPLSEAGITAAGQYGGAIRYGILCLKDVFPLAFSLAVLGYLFIFDMTITGWVMGAMWVTRNLGK